MITIPLPSNYEGPSPGFVRATIKIANPGWSEEQLDAALAEKFQELLKGTEAEGCEWCSS